MIEMTHVDAIAEFVALCSSYGARAARVIVEGALLGKDPVRLEAIARQFLADMRSVLSEGGADEGDVGIALGLIEEAFRRESSCLALVSHHVGGTA